jgi:DNA-binding MarR family transcriptional regulator
MNDQGSTTKIGEELSGLLSVFMLETMRHDTDTLLRFVKRADLTLPLLSALSVVERQGVVSIGELGAKLDFSLANASLLVDKLVCNGCVTRVENVQDRRHKLVQLTDKGRALVNELRTARCDDVARQLLLLPPDVLAQAVAMLREVTAELQLCHAAPPAEELRAAE